MVRKIFLAKLLLIILLVIQLFLIITVFMKPANGKNVGMAIASFVLLPLDLSYLLRLSGMQPGKKSNVFKTLWFTWAVIAGILLCLAWMATHLSFS